MSKKPPKPGLLHIVFGLEYCFKGCSPGDPGGFELHKKKTQAENMTHQAKYNETQENKSGISNTTHF